jgi:integrase/recombinase XerD
LLKHRLLIGLCYGCGLRCAEVRQLRVADVDIEGGMVHVHQGKGNKDRCLPMGAMLARGIRSYVEAEKPCKFLFEGNKGEAYSQRGAIYLHLARPSSSLAFSPMDTLYNQAQ